MVQLAINASKPFAYHFELGARLAPLREDGVLVVASGNVVHNLGLMDPRQPDSGTDWARRFDEAARTTMTTSPGRIVEAARHDDFRLAVPTPDHFIPLLYLAGLADAAGTGTEVLIDGYAYGSLSMTSYTLGLGARGRGPRPARCSAAPRRGPGLHEPLNADERAEPGNG